MISEGSWTQGCRGVTVKLSFDGPHKHTHTFNSEPFVSLDLFQFDSAAI